MPKLRVIGALVLLSLPFTAVACSADDSGGKGSPTSGTCDRSTVDPFSCIEQDSTARAIQDQKAACLERDGDWSTDPCPTEGLIGCCTYELGGDPSRECFYDGFTADAEAYCSMPIFQGTGVWTPVP